MGKSKDIKNVNMEESVFEDVNLQNSEFKNVSLANCKFLNINFSNVNFSAANMSSTRFTHIGLPCELQKKGLRQSSLIFEECDLNNSTFIGCDFTDVKIEKSNIKGLIIDGVEIENLLKK